MNRVGKVFLRTIFFINFDHIAYEKTLLLIMNFSLSEVGSTALHLTEQPPLY